MTATLLALAAKLLKSPLAIAAAGGLVVGLFLGRAIWQCSAPVQEPYAAPVRQADSSLVLERKPDAAAKPTAIVPKGGTVERIVDVTVAPRSSSAHEGTPPPAAQPGPGSSVGLQPPVCPALHVELTLIRMRDGSRRVVASSPDGTILDGVDIPIVAAAPPPRIRHWVAGLLFQNGTSWGAYLARDLGPLQLVALSPPMPWGAPRALVAGVGLRF